MIHPTFLDGWLIGLIPSLAGTVAWCWLTSPTYRAARKHRRDLAAVQRRQRRR